VGRMIAVVFSSKLALPTIFPRKWSATRTLQM
jgi:hypothetical protein